MEKQGRKGSVSGDKFSFPVIPIQDDEFEFGCVSSISSGSPRSPADHLFVNGKLLPHYFPSQPANHSVNGYNSLSRSASRASSVCSKDSLISSRSNSTNSSRSSSCSSARTSTSTTDQAADRKIFRDLNKNPVGKDGFQAARSSNKPVLITPQYYYGSSQRWQFIASAPPALKHQTSVSSRGRKARSRSLARSEAELKPKSRQTKDSSEERRRRRRRTWFGVKIFRACLSACKECHAMEPSSRNPPDKN